VTTADLCSLFISMMNCSELRDNSSWYLLSHCILSINYVCCIFQDNVSCNYMLCWCSNAYIHMTGGGGHG